MTFSELMTPHMISFLTSFVVSSYATALVLIALKAKHEGILDLCAMIRCIMLSPFVTFASGVFLSILSFIVMGIILPNILAIIKWMTILIAGAAIITLLGNFVVAPIVKKSYGITKPFTSKICIVLWKRKI